MAVSGFVTSPPFIIKVVALFAWSTAVGDMTVMQIVVLSSKNNIVVICYCYQRIKVISIVIAVLTINQEVGLGPDTLVRYAVVDGTIVTYIVLGVLIIIGYILGCPLHTKLILISSGAAVILFPVTGGLILDSYVRDSSKNVQVCFGGILALFNGLLYAGDVFLSWKYS